MANEGPKKSEGTEQKEEAVKVSAFIQGVGMKQKTVPAAKLKQELAEIARVGFSIDKGLGKCSIYPVSRIERIDVNPVD